MAETKPTILVVEDDPGVADMLNTFFHQQEYNVITVYWGEDAARVARSHHLDLVILDIRLPDIDGYEVARRLRGNRRTEDIPIIFLTEKRHRQDRLQGLEVGADDYITKPFDMMELRLRVRNALQRSSQAPLTNTVTNLPEGDLVDERLKECVETSLGSLLMIRLQNLDSFRDAYGFVAADDVLRAVSLMVSNAVREFGHVTDFIGHFSPTEFVVVTSPGAISSIADRIRTRLEQSLDFFYPLKDRGIQNYPGKRLVVNLGELDVSQRVYPDLESLKQALLQLLS